MSKFEEMPTWLQCLWRENPTIARQCEAELDKLNSKISELESSNQLSEFQSLVVSGYTDVLACSFSVLHADIEKRLGKPVFTHEIPVLGKEIKAAYHDDFLSICRNGD